MNNRTSRSSFVPLLFLGAVFFAHAAFADPYAVGDAIEPFTLEDQHGESRSVDGSVKVILFSRDMDGGDFLKEGLAEVSPEYLREMQAVYVADISGMPGLIARMFAVPAMRKRPYSMLLDRDGETTTRLPDVEGQATLIFLDRLTVQRIVHVNEPTAVKRELQTTPRTD
jgi:hypothetical protein